MKSSFTSMLCQTSCAILLGLILSAPVYANNQTRISKQTAVQIAKQKVQGKVLKVNQQKGNYKVKILTQKGRVITVTVNGKTGRTR